MIADAKNTFAPGRRKDSAPASAGAAFVARALLGACVGSSVALYGTMAVANGPNAVPHQAQTVALMAVAICVFAVIFLKVQMAHVAGRTHKVRVSGAKKEVFVRRRPEVIAWIVRRWIMFLVCTGAALGALTVGLGHYNVAIPTEPVEKALSQLARMGEDSAMLLYAVGLGLATLALSETTLRMTMKTGLPNQAAWIYVPAIASMAGTLVKLGAK